MSGIDLLEVAVYWPQEGGYGIPTVVHTLESAAAEVAKLRRMGYGGPGTHIPSSIHVRRIRVDLIPIEDLPRGEHQ